MGRCLTRKELHALVWSEPMSKLAKGFGVSDVAMAKACAKVHVPVPPRGYWARKAAGKPASVTDLPPRGLGMTDRVEIPASAYGSYYSPTEAELLGPAPEPPSFEESIEEVRLAIESMVHPFTVPRLANVCHPLVARLLAEDEDRKAKVAAHPYMASYHSPKFSDPVGRRQLRLLSSVLTEVARHGGRTTGQGNVDPERIWVGVGNQGVTVGVRAVETRTRTGKSADRRLVVNRRLVVELNPSHDGTRPARRRWEDGDTTLERQLHEVVVEILVTAESDHRDGVNRAYQYRVDRKAQLEAEARRRVAQAEAAELARLAELERQRVERLLGEAAGLKKARGIRRYVSDVTAENARSSTPMDEIELEEWSRWALAQADRLDPLLNGDFKRRRDG